MQTQNISLLQRNNYLSPLNRLLTKKLNYLSLLSLFYFSSLSVSVQSSLTVSNNQSIKLNTKTNLNILPITASKETFILSNVNSSSLTTSQYTDHHDNVRLHKKDVAWYHNEIRFKRALEDSLNLKILDNSISTERQSARLMRTILVALVSTFFSLATVIGNSLVICAFFLQRSLRTHTNYFIASLAVTDLLIGLCSMNLFTVYLLLDYWPLGVIMCKLWLSLDYTACLTSQYTVLLITVDRYCSVKIPAIYRQWRTKEKVLIGVALTWLLPACLFFTSIFGWPYFTGSLNALSKDSEQSRCYAEFTEDIIFNTVLTIGYFWITLIVMCALYAGIYRVALRLHVKSETRQKHTKQTLQMSRTTNNDKQASGDFDEEEDYDEYEECEDSYEEDRTMRGLFRGDKNESVHSRETRNSVLHNNRSDLVCCFANSAQSNHETNKRSLFVNKNRKNNLNKNKTIVDKTYSELTRMKNSKMLAETVDTETKPRFESLGKAALRSGAQNQVGVTMLASNHSKRSRTKELALFARHKEKAISKQIKKNLRMKKALETRKSLTMNNLLLNDNVMSSCMYHPVQPESYSDKFYSFEQSFNENTTNAVKKSYFSSDIIPFIDNSSSNSCTHSTHLSMQFTGQTESLEINKIEQPVLNINDLWNNVSTTTSLQNEKNMFFNMNKKTDDHKTDIVLSRENNNALETQHRFSTNCQQNIKCVEADQNLTKTTGYICCCCSSVLLNSNVSNTDDGSGSTKSSQPAVFPIFLSSIAQNCELNNCQNRHNCQVSLTNRIKSIPSIDNQKTNLHQENSVNLTPSHNRSTVKNKQQRKTMFTWPISAKSANYRRSKTENRAFKALRVISLILGAFVICWTPYHVLILVRGFCKHWLGQFCINDTLYNISYWLCYLNSPINPFCYALANTQIKQALLRLLRFNFKRN